MKTWRTLDTEACPDGSKIVLCERDGEFAIRSGGKTLMSSWASRSEVEMATLVGKELAGLPKPRALVGGLGMGFTLRALLDELPPQAKVRVVELLPKTVAWNRDVLANLASRPLDDPRVILEVADIYDVIARSPGTYDAILLDVDNGPQPFCYAPNRRLYAKEGLERIRRGLKNGGVFSLWSIQADQRFHKLLVESGFRVTVCGASAYGAPGTPARGQRHVIYLARAASGS